MKLYFVNSQKEHRFIADVETGESAADKIKEFCQERNFNIPYIRAWGNPNKGGMWFDVSSHTEFFVMKNER